MFLVYCLLWILEAHRDADRASTSGRMCVGVRVGGCITESSVYSSLCGWVSLYAVSGSHLALGLCSRPRPTDKYVRVFPVKIHTWYWTPNERFCVGMRDRKWFMQPFRIVLFKLWVNGKSQRKGHGCGRRVFYDCLCVGELAFMANTKAVFGMTYCSHIACLI